MKSLKHYIIEALNSRQQGYVDDIVRRADHTARDTDFSDHVFGGPSSGLGRWDDKDVVVLPFDKGEFLEPPHAVVQHLANHGYKVHDWMNRLAIRSDVPAGKKVNPIGIGKIMDKTAGSESHYWAENKLKQHNAFRPYMNKDLEIMVTRHPYHVAEQSTNKGWRSCLTLGICPDEDRGFIGDMEERDAIKSFERGQEQARRLGRANQAPGEHFHKVESDILGGTHMAYLIKKGDYKLKNPLARISLKPYHSEDIENKISSYILSQRSPGAPLMSYRHQAPWNKIKPEHTILRPLGRTYRLQEFGGSNPLIDKFEENVKEFTEKHFPMKEHIPQYHLDDLVQRDSGAKDRVYNVDYRYRRRYSDPDNIDPLDTSR